MGRKTNLIQRSGRWYFNRAFPKELWPIVGKAPFRVALETDSLETALRRRPDAERRYFAAVDQARARVVTRSLKELSEIEAAGLAARWFKTRYDERVEEIEEDRSVSVDLDSELEELDHFETEARQAIAENDTGLVKGLASQLLRTEHYEVDPRSKAFKALQRALLRARRELMVLERARLLGDYRKQPEDPLFIAAYSESTSAPQRSLIDLIEAHKADKVSKRSLSTQAAYEPVWRFLKDVLGPNRALSTIGREDGRLLFETAKALPKGIGKNRKLRGLKIPEAVEKGRELKLATIAPKTINGVYMGLMKTIFAWGVREQWLPANPLSGLLVDDDVVESEKRDPFTAEQLTTIFNLSPWAPRNESPRGKPLHFWGPLIALFHGMRRGEIAQLDADSITEVEGYPVIEVRGGSGKRLKTANARRTLPIHPELIRMGFLAFAKTQQRAGSEKLFPGEQPNARGQWGDGFSDWFSRVIQKEGLEGARLGLHSFRHNWQDRAREAGLHRTAIGQELAGRAKGGLSEDDYGKGHSTAALAEASRRIMYPDLDLSHLYVAGSPGSL